MQNAKLKTFKDFVFGETNCFVCGNRLFANNFKLLIQTIRAPRSTDIIDRKTLTIEDGLFVFSISNKYFESSRVLKINPITNSIINTYEEIIDIVKNKTYSFYSECSRCLSFSINDKLIFDIENYRIDSLRKMMDVIYLENDLKKRYNIDYINSNFKDNISTIFLLDGTITQIKSLNKDNYSDIYEMLDKVSALLCFA